MVTSFDLLEGSGGVSVTPSPGLSSDLSVGAGQPSPVPSSHSLGGPYSGFEGSDNMQVPSPIAGYGTSTMSLDSSGHFSSPSMSVPMHTGVGMPNLNQSNFYGQAPVGMIVQGTRPGPGQSYYQTPSQALPVVIPGAIRHPVGVTAPGSPNLGVGGSPARIMTRGGKSPAASLSSSPSGPGLEDAVKALGLTMSPSKGVGKSSTKPESRPLSPGQPTNVGAGNAGLFGYPVGNIAPGGYGEMGGEGDLPDPTLSQGTQEYELTQSGQGISSTIFIYVSV